MFVVPEKGMYVLKTLGSRVTLIKGDWWGGRLEYYQKDILIRKSLLIPSQQEIIHAKQKGDTEISEFKFTGTIGI